jgi:hypothetical protein
MGVCLLCVLSGRGLCDELITRPEEPYQLWCIVVCGQETSWYEEAIACAGLQSQKKKVTFIKAQFQIKSNVVKSQLNPLHIIKINLILDLRKDKKDAATNVTYSITCPYRYSRWPGGNIIMWCFTTN